MRLSLKHIFWLKILLHLAAMLPLLWLVYAVSQGDFSADSAKDIQHFTGRMALKLLLASLLVTPLARYGRQPLLIRCRRLLGLWCFAWATLHLASYALLELWLDNLRLLSRKLVTCPYLVLGMTSWMILLLACISTLWAQRKLKKSLVNHAQSDLYSGHPSADSLYLVSQNPLAADGAVCRGGAGASGLTL